MKTGIITNQPNITRVMTSNVTLGSPNGFPVTLNIPIDADPNHDYSIEYTFTGNILKRQMYDSSSNLTSDTWIAQYVDTDNTTFESIADGFYKLTIRVSMGEEAVAASYEARPRLILVE